MKASFPHQKYRDNIKLWKENKDKIRESLEDIIDHWYCLFEAVLKLSGVVGVSGIQTIDFLNLFLLNLLIEPDIGEWGNQNIESLT